MRFFRFLTLVMCAEWLLIFRIWVSFRFLLLFVGVCYFRARILRLHPALGHVLYRFSCGRRGMLYHLRSMWRGRSARYRDFYTTPESGVPWLIMVAQTPKAAQLLEYVIMMAFLFYMMSYGHLVYPHEFRALPPAWQAWLSDPANAELFSAAYAISAMFGLSLWNLIASGVPLESPEPQTPKPTRMCGKHPTVPQAPHRQGACRRTPAVVWVILAGASENSLSRRLADLLKHLFGPGGVQSVHSETLKAG